MPGYPLQTGIVQPKIGLGQFPFNHYGARERRLELSLTAGQDRLDPFPTRFSLGRTHKYGKTTSLTETIAQKIGSQLPGGAGE
jgi:hypothetical protein